jgi:nicotinamide riboside kinase
MNIIRIAILGAECTGKTSLCQTLARAIPQVPTLQSIGIEIAIVPEALRQFCETHQRVPMQHEQLGIMRQQAMLERTAENALKKKLINLVLSDCAPITTAVYSELYFSDCHLFEEASAHHKRYDLSLLLYPTLDWQADGLFRESMEAQNRFHARIKAWLTETASPWLEISETGGARAASALNAIIPLLR